MIKYIIPNSYGVGDALILLNAIFLFEKNKNRYITLTFHQRDNENVNFNFLHVSDIFSYLYLKPCSINCNINYDRSSLELYQFEEKNFKNKDFEDFYFNVVQNHILELDMEICQSRKGISSLFYEIEEIDDKEAQKRYGYNQKSITKEQYNQLKNTVKIKE
ncbi:uncharacterized protein METZ01_LOCUS436421, partial [marine metagenome]